MENYQTIKIGKIKTSKNELVDIGKAWVVLSLAFALVLSSTNLLQGTISNIFSVKLIVYFLISLFTAGIGFLFHELAHKFVAQKYGCVAEFRAFDQMLYLALGLAAVIGFIFAAPGAVMIAGRVTLKENGWISLSGPLTNFGLSILFILLMFFFPLTFNLGNSSLSPWYVGYFINTWLGLFNLLPFGNFDGRKILEWHRYIWLAMVLIGIGLLWGLPKLL